MASFRNRQLRHVLVILVVAALLGACVPGAGKKVLVLPDDAARPAAQPKAAPVPTYSPQEWSRRMLSWTDVGYQGVAASPVYTDALAPCLLFLAKNFGPPLYQGRVNLVVSSNPGDNGRMSWSDQNRRQRTITLHEYNFLPSERRVVVHELFHAFYQTNAFIKSMPDFVTEGMAVYAEYVYRYGSQMSNAAIAKKMRAQSLALDRDIERRQIDFDKSFGLYSPKEMDVMYLLAGRFMFDQFPRGTDAERLRAMLAYAEPNGRQLSFDSVVQLFRFRTGQPYMTRRGQAYDLPAADLIPQ